MDNHHFGGQLYTVSSTNGLFLFFKIFHVVKILPTGRCLFSSAMIGFRDPTVTVFGFLLLGLVGAGRCGGLSQNDRVFWALVFQGNKMQQGIDKEDIRKSYQQIIMNNHICSYIYSLRHSAGPLAYCRFVGCRRLL